MVERLATGIPKLDEIIGGGFLKGRTYLIAGGTGTGKTIMSLQYLLYGLKNDETCVYVSFDDRIVNVLSGVKNIGWNFDPYISSGKFIPFEIRLRTEDLRHGKDSKSFVRQISKYIGKRDVNRLVLDPISTLAQGVGDMLWVREYIREIVSFLEEEIGCTTVVTADIPSGSNSLSRYGVEEFLSSGIIVLEFTRVKGRFYRTLYVRKMRWSEMDPYIYTFEIKSGEGIVIGKRLMEFTEV